MKPTFGLIIPTFNNASTIRHILEEGVNGLFAAAVTSDHMRIVVIDDGSTDGTYQEVRRKGPYDAVCIGTNQGVGAATKAGFNYLVKGSISTDYILKLDGDGQHDPLRIPNVVTCLIDGADLVICARFHPDSEQINTPPDRLLLNIIFAAAIEAITGVTIYDARSGFVGMPVKHATLLAEEMKVQRYGVPMEIILRIWHACGRNPKIVSIPHPAIYGSNAITPEQRVRYNAQDGRHRSEQSSKQIERFGFACNAIAVTLTSLGLIKEFDWVIAILNELEQKFKLLIESESLTSDNVGKHIQTFVSSLQHFAHL